MEGKEEILKKTKQNKEEEILSMMSISEVLEGTKEKTLRI